MLVRDRIRIAESFLYHIWDGQHLRQAELKTTDGRRLEVISKGRWNPDAGPDFREAVLKIGGELKRGDVEIHIQKSDWRAHGHQRDPKYNGVILHAVLWPEEKSTAVRTQEGREIPTLILSDFLDDTLERLQIRIEDDAPIQAEKPDICLLGQRGPEEIGEILEYWGKERLRIKKERFQEDLNYFNYDQLLYQGIMEALGYAKNQRPFFKLALKVPVEAVWEILNSYSAEKHALVAQAIYLGAAGFLQEIPATVHSASDYLHRLQKMWQVVSQTFDFEAMPPQEWTFFRLRPANFPTVRTVGMADLAVRFRERGFLTSALEILRDRSNSLVHTAHTLRRLFVVPASGFWRRHYRLDKDLTPHAAFQLKHLVGTNRAGEIAVNVLFPILLLYAEKTGDEKLKARVLEVYRNFPKLQENQIIREMRVQILSPDSQKQRLVSSAVRQQGLIHIYKSFCRSWSCSRCVVPKFRNGK